MNPNHVELTRIYTRKLNGNVADTTPISGTSGNTAAFEVVVEGEAGEVIGKSLQPYDLTISAIDLTDVRNPNSGQNKFTHTVTEKFDGANGPLWKDLQYKRVFRIQLQDVASVRNDLLRYLVVLNSQNEVDSSLQSPMFTLTQ